jgi:hypothetical protein
MIESVARLLDKYYAGQTSEEEETLLKNELLATDEAIPEKDLFSYYSAGTTLPVGLEESLFGAIEEKTRMKNYRIRIYSITSVAAAFLTVFSLYTGYLSEKRTEKDFFIMEQALSRVSDSLQPDAEESEMLVLWLDDNVEIIIN